jgi:hypothetical protein
MIFDPRWLPLLLAEISYGKRKGINWNLSMKFRSQIENQVSNCKKRFNLYEIFYDRTRKRWPFNTIDCLTEVTEMTNYFSDRNKEKQKWHMACFIITFVLFLKYTFIVLFYFKYIDCFVFIVNTFIVLFYYPHAIAVRGYSNSGSLSVRHTFLFTR